MHIAIRVDASRRIGIGHVMRCLTLADALARLGAQVRFVCRHLPQSLAQMIGSRGHQIRVLQAAHEAHALDELSHAASQAQDAKDTCAALGDAVWDWLVVDHYAIDARWESSLRTVARYIMVIDDVADRRHDCEVLLDQNIYPHMHDRYSDLVSSGCQQLLGPHFALLRDEFRELRAQVTPRAGEIRRILVLFGGVDPHDLTGRSLTALCGLDGAVPLVDVVIGAEHPCRERIQAQCAQAGYALHVQTNEVAGLMARADLALGAGGSTSWERCCLGLATVCTSFADNQYHIARALEEEGVCVFLGDEADVTSARIAAVIADLRADSVRLSGMSARAFALVDGAGASRVCDLLAQRA